MALVLEQERRAGERPKEEHELRRRLNAHLLELGREVRDCDSESREQAVEAWRGRDRVDGLGQSNRLKSNISDDPGGGSRERMRTDDDEEVCRRSMDGPLRGDWETDSTRDECLAECWLRRERLQNVGAHPQQTVVR